MMAVLILFGLVALLVMSYLMWSRGVKIWEVVIQDGSMFFKTQMIVVAR